MYRAYVIIDYRFKGRIPACRRVSVGTKEARRIILICQLHNAVMALIEPAFGIAIFVTSEHRPGSLLEWKSGLKGHPRAQRRRGKNGRDRSIIECGRKVSKLKASERVRVEVS